MPVNSRVPGFTMIIRAIVRFTRIFASGGLLLMAAAAAALVWANSPFAAGHERILAVPVTVGAGAPRGAVE